MATNFLAKKLAVGLIVVAAMWSAGCGQKDASKGPAEKDKYDGWQYSVFGNIKIFHPPNHPQQAQFESIARSYVRDIDEISRLLGMETPRDTLVIYYYTGFGQGRDMTGQEYPFAKDSVIYFWLPSFIGPTLVDHLLPYWVQGEPRYQFLRHGIRSLFDYSGQNYHKTTLQYIRDTQFIPLEKLEADTAINSNTERYQSAEAASFVAYILAYYGGARLKTMYLARQPFDEMIQQLFYMPVDSLQSGWLGFVRESVPPDTSTIQNAQ